MAPARPPPPPVGVAGPGPGPPSRQPAGWRRGEASWCVLKKGWEPSEELSGSVLAFIGARGVFGDTGWDRGITAGYTIHMDCKTMMPNARL